MIPKKLHFIWYGPDEIPDVSSWIERHPGWEIRIWREGDISLENNRIYEYFASRKLYYGMSDVSRVEILIRHGGVYMDMDVECTRSIDEAPFMGSDFWCVYEPTLPELVANGMIGAVAEHPILMEYKKRIGELSTEDVLSPWKHTGPRCLTGVLRGFSDVQILPSYSFIPNKKDGSCVAIDGDNYGVHGWMSTKAVQKAANTKAANTKGSFSLAEEHYKCGRHEDAEKLIEEYIENTKGGGREGACLSSSKQMPLQSRARR